MLFRASQSASRLLIPVEALRRSEKESAAYPPRYRPGCTRARLDCQLTLASVTSPHAPPAFTPHLSHLQKACFLIKLKLAESSFAHAFVCIMMDQGH
jgi:hypothetical protein